MKIIGKPTPTKKIDDKRFYIPGVVIEEECPRCGTTCRWDGSKDYIRYPCFEGTENIPFYCSKCDEYFNRPVKITIQVIVEEIK